MKLGTTSQDSKASILTRFYLLKIMSCSEGTGNAKLKLEVKLI
jgi:hypothetical protein